MASRWRRKLDVAFCIWPSKTRFPVEPTGHPRLLCVRFYPRGRRPEDAARHYSKVPAVISTLLTWLRLASFPRCLPITDRENELLNLVPGSPITHTPPHQDSTKVTAGWSAACTPESPMSLGSPAGTVSLLHLPWECVPTWLHLRSSAAEESPPAHDVEEEMGRCGRRCTKEEKDEDWRQTRLVHPNQHAPCLVHRQGLNRKTKTNS